MEATEIRQQAQVLIAALVHDSPDFERLLDEAAVQQPADLLLCLAGFLDIHTRQVNAAVADGPEMLIYVAGRTLAGLEVIAHERGGDPFEFLRGLLLSASSDDDPHLPAAQSVLAAAKAGGEIYETVIAACIPAWARVCGTLLDIWLTASLDALAVCRAQPLLLLFLESARDILAAMARFSGCETDEMLEAYWTALVEQDAVA